MRFFNWLFGNPNKVAVTSDTPRPDVITTLPTKHKPPTTAQSFLTAVFGKEKKSLIEAIKCGDIVAINSCFQELAALPENEKHTQLCALKDEENASILIVAFKSPAYANFHSRDELVKVLVSNISTECKRNLIVSRDIHGLTAIHHTAKNGDIDTMKQLLKCARNEQEKQYWLNDRSTTAGYTPLHWATAYNHTALATYLCNVHQVNETARSAKGYTAEDLKKFTRTSKMTSSTTEEAPLMQAIERGNNIVVESRFAELNTLPANQKLAAILNLQDAKNTNLLIAILKSQSYPNSRLRQKLIINLFENLTLEEQRHLITREDANGLTALHHAATLSDNDIMAYLLSFSEKGAAKNEWLNKQSNNGYTALHWAADNGHKRVMTILQDYGADQTILSNEGYTASDLKTLFDRRKKEDYHPSTVRQSPLALMLPGTVTTHHTKYERVAGESPTPEDRIKAIEAKRANSPLSSFHGGNILYTPRSNVVFHR